MAEVKRNAKRDRRIEREILVETYSAEDDAMAWYNYLEETLHFPFRAYLHRREDHLASAPRRQNRGGRHRS